VKVPLPNLDDRRWADLVDEGRALIPVYAPEWTDHNVHDPGITLIELFAWIAEMDIYQLNRIADEHKLKFLELVGVLPEPPRAARGVVSFSLKPGATHRKLKANTQLSCKDPFGESTQFRLLERVTISPGELAAVEFKDSKGFHDLTARWQRHETLTVFGDYADPGTEFYLGFTEPLKPGNPLSVFFRFAGGHSSDEARLRLIEEEKARSKRCPHAGDCTDECCEDSSRQSGEKYRKVLRLPRVRLAWEFSAEVDGQPRWLRLDPNAGQLEDGTRSLTLDGSVIFRVARDTTPLQLGHASKPLHYLRCRFEGGAFDAPPVLTDLIINSAAVEQAVPVTATWIVKAGTTVQGSAPQPGDNVAIEVDFDPAGRVVALGFQSPTDQVPGLKVLEYKPPTPSQKGSLTVRAARLEQGNGRPNQKIDLPVRQAQQSGFKLFSEESGRWRRWQRVDDFVRSTRRDAHFVLDATRGKLIFGDGEKGRVPPSGAKLFAVYRSTRAEEGNVAAGGVFELVDSPLNRVVVSDFDATKASIKSISNLFEVSGGEAAETLDHAMGRAAELVTATWRAVTLRDYEELAKKTPGARIARATARAALHPSFPCFSALGIVTLLVVPDMPGPRPSPSRGLLNDVLSYLQPRRVIGTRVEVIGPSYVEVTVRATVKSLAMTSKNAVQQRIVDALNQFFDPLEGGPEHNGWPFGRDVYRSEVMQVIDEVAGVDHLLSLDLVADGCAPQCGNLCLRPTWLVASVAHQIEVV